MHESLQSISEQFLITYLFKLFSLSPLGSVLSGDERKLLKRGRSVLGAHDCKYRESLPRQKKSKILIICQKNPFGELSSKKIFSTFKNLQFRENEEKRKQRFLPNLLCKNQSKNDLLYRVCTEARFKAIKQKYFCLKEFYLFFLSMVRFKP